MGMRPTLWTCLAILLLALGPRAAAAAPADAPGAAVLAGFLQNVARWFEYLASLVAVATVAYGGLRHAAAHTARDQAEAWRIVLAGLAGLVIALLAPTLVAVVEGLVPS
jgi:FtsH-binding integral membrane protein